MSLFRRGLFVIGVAVILLAAFVLAGAVWLARVLWSAGKGLLGWLASALMEDDEARAKERRERTAW
jgi:hypothetical protein